MMYQKMIHVCIARMIYVCVATMNSVSVSPAAGCRCNDDLCKCVSGCQLPLSVSSHLYLPAQGAVSDLHEPCLFSRCSCGGFWDLQPRVVRIE